jgi:hypothetical protein
MAPAIQKSEYHFFVFLMKLRLPESRTGNGEPGEAPLFSHCGVYFNRCLVLKRSPTLGDVAEDDEGPPKNGGTRGAFFEPLLGLRQTKCIQIRRARLLRGVVSIRPLWTIA